MAILLGKQLRQHQRYTFTETNPSTLETIQFRANFLDIITGHLRVRKYEDNKTKLTSLNGYAMYVIPLEWITNVETLYDILFERSRLPQEMILEIDKY